MSLSHPVPQIFSFLVGLVVELPFSPINVKLFAGEWAAQKIEGCLAPFQHEFVWKVRVCVCVCVFLPRGVVWEVFLEGTLGHWATWAVGQLDHLGHVAVAQINVAKRPPW